MLTPLRCGLPQGSPLSPLLSNFYLDPFDRALRAMGIPLLRYADDFLLLARTPWELEEARRVAERELTSLELEVHPGKTHVRMAGSAFRFLGAQVTPGNILIPLPRSRMRTQPRFCAPVMPPAMLAAWRRGHL